MIVLTPAQRRALRAQAHALRPVVIVGEAGLSASVLKEIETSLASHELIKIRLFNDDRLARAAVLATICTELDAAEVQHIGKILVVYKPNPEKKAAPPTRRRSEPRRTKRSHQND